MRLTHQKVKLEDHHKFDFAFGSVRKMNYRGTTNKKYETISLLKYLSWLIVISWKVESTKSLISFSKILYLNFFRFKEIDKTPFGRNAVEYSDAEGYYNKGGFIHYFQSNLTAEEAHAYYKELVEDGLYDRNLMALTLEVTHKL